MNRTMKKLFFLIGALLTILPAMAGGRHLSALFGSSTLYLPQNNQTYVETYLNFDAWSLNFVKEDEGRYRATVEVTLVVRQGDSVAYLKKYDLHSPYTSSEEATNFTFFDLQRFGLDNGIYDLELTLHDKAAEDQSFTFSDKLVVFYQNGKTAMSNIQLMSSATPTEQTNMLSRNGYDMVPYIDDFIPADIDALHPYIELYNLDKELDGKPYTINYYIEQNETGHRLAEFDTHISRSTSSQYDPIYANIDIAKLPSGNYNLTAVVCNLSGDELMKKSLTFHRSNPSQTVNPNEAEMSVMTSFAALITDEKLLDYYISALYPISSYQEITVARQITSHPGLEAKQTYLYNFWVARDAVNPAAKWNEYLGWLTYVDNHFSYPKTPGYKTDRGRVYLQYGPPDFIRDEKNYVSTRTGGYMPDVSNTVNATTTDNPYIENQHGQIHYLPYQLWRYNLLPGDDANRVFIFWDEHRSGFYKLLNSNARGELRTFNWERVLSQNQLDENTLGAVGEQFQRGH